MAGDRNANDDGDSMTEFNESGRLDDLGKLRFSEIRKGHKWVDILTEKIQELDPTRFQDQLLESRVRLLLDLLRESVYDRYQDLSLLAFAHIVVALDYFMRNDDEIPDTQVGGYSDDLKVIQRVLTDFNSEIDAFKEWRSRQPKDIPV